MGIDFMEPGFGPLDILTRRTSVPSNNGAAERDRSSSVISVQHIACTDGLSLTRGVKVHQNTPLSCIPFKIVKINFHVHCHTA